MHHAAHRHNTLNNQNVETSISENGSFNLKRIPGGIIIVNIEPSEIKQRIRETIKEGLDRDYLDLVKALEDSFYPEDIAAAAIMLYAKQGSRREVRRRTLSKAPFIPLRTKETVARSAKKLPTMQAQSRPTVARKAPVRPAAQPGARPGAKKDFGDRSKAPKGQQGPQRPKGSQGPQRPRGPQAPRGPQGQKGQKGFGGQGKSRGQRR